MRSLWTPAGLLLLVTSTSCGGLAGETTPDTPLAPPPRVVVTIEVARISAVDAGAGGVWTSNYENGSVSLVDPAHNDVVEEIQVDRELGSGPTGLKVVGGHVWLAAGDSHTIGHLDPNSLKVTAAADAGPAGIVDMAASDSEVWLAQHSDMKPADYQTIHGTQIRSATKEVPPPGKYSIYSDIVAGDAGVWALDESQGTLAAISPVAGTPHIAASGEGEFSGAQGEIAVGHGYAWIETSDGLTSKLARFDPATKEIETIVLDGRDGVMAIGPDALWVLTHQNEQGILWRIDPTTVTTQPDPFILDGEYVSSEITYGFGSIWVSHDTNLLTRIDVSGGEPPREPVPSPEARGDGDVCDEVGPWVYCPEATWLRRVVTEAGLEVTGDTGTALEVSMGSQRFFAWNADATKPVAEIAAAEDYERREGTEVFSDGERLLWKAQGLHIYLSSANEASTAAIPDAVLHGLVAASRSVPMEVDLSGAKPQPTPTGEQRFEQARDQVRVWPVTEDVEDDGTYLFSAPHCGLDWMIDFDASFWETVKPDDYGDGESYPFFYNSDQGTITFTGADTAIYQASTGEKIQLKRLPGPITVHPCA